ncbi:MAG: insulinase family protein, partial [Clostridia bacterium]|nr:insulinase family protein [Clostridia bacterium]
MRREMQTERVALNWIETDKFKSNFLSVSFAVPFEKTNAAKNALILKILKRGTVSYPDMIALSKKLEYLYSAEIYTKTACFGETQLLQFSLDVLDDRFAMENTDILAEGLKVLSEIIFAPVTENGIFKQAYFESEKRNLLDDIHAEINNKGKYALLRACEHMFAN